MILSKDLEAQALLKCNGQKKSSWVEDVECRWHHDVLATHSPISWWYRDFGDFTMNSYKEECMCMVRLNSLAAFVPMLQCWHWSRPSKESLKALRSKEGRSLYSHQKPHHVAQETSRRNKTLQAEHKWQNDQQEWHYGRWVFSQQSSLRSRISFSIACTGQDKVLRPL